MNALNTFGVAGDSTLVTAADAATLIGTIMGFIKDNLMFILPLVGFGIGYAIFIRHANKAVKGKL